MNQRLIMDLKPKTKIVCALVPASRSVPMVKKLLHAGMSVARFNFSHGSHEYHQETLNNLRAVMESTGILSYNILELLLLCCFQRSQLDHTEHRRKRQEKRLKQGSVS